jgi:hypothetical protein
MKFHKTHVTSKLVAGLVGLACLGGAVGAGGSALAGTATPEIDRANATMQLNGNLRGISCVGEDKMPYVTYVGSYAGGESQMLPDPTDYPLSGPLSISGVAWTINTKTGRGVLTGTITLGPAGAVPVYSGKLTLVTQGVPAATGAPVPGRGWIVANIKHPDEGATPGDDNLVANVEFAISPFSAMGQFGDVPGSMGIPDFSVVTNVAPTAADGVC